MQIVVCKNKVLAYGLEGSFLNVDGTVVCNESGTSFQNATIISTDTPIPSDIDTVGYEYEFGVFTAAPYSTSALAVVEINRKTPVKYWYGTTAEFNAIAVKDENTDYRLTDDDTATVLDEIAEDINGILGGTTSVPNAAHATTADTAVNATNATNAVNATNATNTDFTNSVWSGTVPSAEVENGTYEVQLTISASTFNGSVIITKDQSGAVVSTSVYRYASNEIMFSTVTIAWDNTMTATVRKLTLSTGSYDEADTITFRYRRIG